MNSPRTRSIFVQKCKLSQSITAFRALTRLLVILSLASSRDTSKRQCACAKNYRPEVRRPVMSRNGRHMTNSCRNYKNASYRKRKRITGAVDRKLLLSFDKVIQILFSISNFTCIISLVGLYEHSNRNIKGVL